MIALICGPDAATARSEVEKLLSAHDPAGLNTTRLDGKTLSLDQAIGAVRTPSFFGGGRVVVIDGLMARIGKSGKADDSRADDGDDPTLSGRMLDLSGLLSAVPPENILILVDSGLASVPAAVRKQAPSDAVIISAEPPRAAALVEWIQATARAAGSEIGTRVARSLAERLFPQTWAAKPSNPAYDRPPDLDQLRNEIDKLALAAHPGPIEQAHLAAMVAGHDEDLLFPLLEGLLASNLGQAVTALETLQSSGEDIARATAQAYQQVELATVLAGRGPAVDPVAVGKEVGLANPNRMIGVSKALQRGRLPPDEILQRTVAIDRAQKRGELRQPQDAIYALLTVSAPAERTAPTPRRSGN